MAFWDWFKPEQQSVDAYRPGLESLLMPRQSMEAVARASETKPVAPLSALGYEAAKSLAAPVRGLGTLVQSARPVSSTTQELENLLSQPIRLQPSRSLAVKEARALQGRNPVGAADVPSWEVAASTEAPGGRAALGAAPQGVRGQGVYDLTTSDTDELFQLLEQLGGKYKGPVSGGSPGPLGSREWWDTEVRLSELPPPAQDIINKLLPRHGMEEGAKADMYRRIARYAQRIHQLRKQGESSESALYTREQLMDAWDQGLLGNIAQKHGLTGRGTREELISKLLKLRRQGEK